MAQTILFGGDYNGHDWHRANDKVGVAFVSNAIKRDHQNYLHYGGLGFLLGDGNLTYGREDIVEWYYNAHVWRGIVCGGRAEPEIAHPGYNADRGPVYVTTVRAQSTFEKDRDQGNASRGSREAREQGPSGQCLGSDRLTLPAGVCC